MLTAINTNKPTYDSGVDYNGQRLLIMPVSKRLYEQLVERKEKMQESIKQGNAMQQAYILAAQLLNENTLGIRIPDEEVEGLDIITIKSILEGYTAFVRGVKNDPN